MCVNLLRRARRNYHGMGGKGRLQMVHCIWCMGGRQMAVMCGRKEHRFNKCADEHEVDYQRWVGSVLSASWWNMKGVRCQRKEYRCKRM